MGKKKKVKLKEGRPRRADCAHHGRGAFCCHNDEIRASALRQRKRNNIPRQARPGQSPVDREESKQTKLS